MEAHLEVEDGASAGRVFVIRRGENRTLGRQADFVLDDPTLAPEHVALAIQEGAVQAMDLGAPGGTLHNGQPMRPYQAVVIQAGDDLTLGSHLVRFEVLGASGELQRRAPSADTGVEAILPPAELTQLRELGNGATGRVYAAFWVPHQRWVAVKVLHAEVRSGSEDYERFFREAQTVSRLNSPYVVAVHDVRRTAEGRAYFIMELVNGPSAREALVRLRQMEIAEALRIGLDVARALAAAAAEGIVHRDVKPGNIVLSPQGCAKLCDFGLAKDLDSTLESLTVSGMGLGTMAYLPPEQVAEAKHVQPSADVYSLGATLYHLLAGQPPFRPTTAESLVLILEQDPPPLSSLRPDCPADVAQVVHAMLGKAPDDRPTLRRVVRALERLLASHYPGFSFARLFGPGPG